MAFGTGFGSGFGGGFARAAGAGEDTVPDFIPGSVRSNMPVSTVIQFSPFTITGIDTETAWSITDGEARINGGAWGVSGTLLNLDVVETRLTTSDDPGVGVTAVLNVGGVTANFTATTRAEGVVDIFPQKGGGACPPRNVRPDLWGWYLAAQKNRARRRQAQG